MSKQNGDRARFQRMRKAALRRRVASRAAHDVLKAAARERAAAASRPEGA